MQGWIKLHRKILDHWCASEPEALAVWCRLMLEANHKTNKKMFNGKLIEIKRGQLIFGLNAFSAKSGVSVAKIRRYLKLFETEKMISKQITSKFSVITITCFDDYQGDDKQNASKQQAGDKQKTTPKECKNEENENNNDNFDFELCKVIWNEEKSISDCPSTGCNIVPVKFKSGIGKVHKAYQSFCKSSGKAELPKHDWLRGYAKGHLNRCESFVGKSEGYSWKPSILNLAEMKTFEALINQ